MRTLVKLKAPHNDGASHVHQLGFNWFSFAYQTRLDDQADIAKLLSFDVLCGKTEWPADFLEVIKKIDLQRIYFVAHHVLEPQVRFVVEHELQARAKQQSAIVTDIETYLREPS